MSPEHYRLQSIFHISAFGNWQEGLGFFSSFMVLIGILIYSLADQVLAQKFENSDTRGCTKKCKKCTLIMYKIGSILLLAGLIITGCFQQTFNKPGHNIGLSLLCAGFVMMVIDDLCYCLGNSCKCQFYCCCLRTLTSVGVAQLILSILIFFMVVAFAVFHIMSKNEWNKGKVAALKRHNLTSLSECPGKTMNDWLNGEIYPNFYPCKSKSLWEPDDPGWEFYEISAYLEITLFSLMILYTFTYCWLLNPEKVELPKCLQNSQIKNGPYDSIESGGPDHVAAQSETIM